MKKILVHDTWAPMGVVRPRSRHELNTHSGKCRTLLRLALLLLEARAGYSGKFGDSECSDACTFLDF